MVSRTNWLASFGSCVCGLTERESPAMAVIAANMNSKPLQGILGDRIACLFDSKIQQQVAFYTGKEQTQKGWQLPATPFESTPSEKAVQLAIVSRNSSEPLFPWFSVLPRRDIPSRSTINYNANRGPNSQ